MSLHPTLPLVLAAATTIGLVAGDQRLAAQTARPTLAIQMWNAGKVAFGVYAPNEDPTPRQAPAPGQPRPPQRPAVYTKAGAEKLAANPLYDFVFLNLEGQYDAAAIAAMAEGLKTSPPDSRKTLLVRIPPIEHDGAATTQARIKEAFDRGADGVTVPHVRSVEEAKQALGFFAPVQSRIWSKGNPGGDRLAMLMIEDPGALAQAAAFADLKGYSMLACGIGSLAQAMGGDRQGAEAGTQKVLAEAKRTGLVDMLPATVDDVRQRVKEGFLGILGQGPAADEMIKIGRAAAGR